MPYEGSRGKQCVVVGCNNNQRDIFTWKNTNCELHGEKHEFCICVAPFKFHCLPKSTNDKNKENDNRRRGWLKAINRKDYNPKGTALVCSKHFVEGRPTKENPLPTLNMGYDASSTPKPRRKIVRKPLDSIDYQGNQSQDTTEEVLMASKWTDYDQTACSYLRAENEQCMAICCHLYPNLCKNSTAKPVMVDSCTQTEDFVKMDHPYAYDRTTRNVAVQHTTPEFSIENTVSNTDAKFYTGLSYTVLMTLIATLSPFGKTLSYKLNVADQILSVLMRLRLGLNFHDIGRRFNISRQLAACIFNSWIDIMAVQLSECIVWLPRETICRILPSSFQDLYPKTTCIIDCTEVFIQRPFSLKARNQTYSNYKNHNTAKFLVAIAPNGYIMYVSKAYGGRASDNFITKSCGFLDYLLPGDEVMADRGFTIGEELCARRVKLNIPAFMKGREQLSQEETIESRRIASVRIHVERAINRLKCYRIMSTTINIKSVRNIDKIMRVTAGLCNLQESLIKDDTSED